MTARSHHADDLLGPLERRVMEVLWTHGPSTAREVLDALNEGAERPLAYTTITTILVRLHEKGYASREAPGRQFTYTAAHGRDELANAVGRRDLERLIARYGAPAVAGFAEDLAGEHPDLLRRLRGLAESGRENDV
jgi:predicted transcriptional regulator